MKRAIDMALGKTPDNCASYAADSEINIELSAYMSYFCKQLLGSAENIDRFITRNAVSLIFPILYPFLKVKRRRRSRSGRMGSPRMHDMLCGGFSNVSKWRISRGRRIQMKMNTSGGASTRSKLVPHKHTIRFASKSFE